MNMLTIQKYITTLDLVPEFEKIYSDTHSLVSMSFVTLFVANSMPMCLEP